MKESKEERFSRVAKARTDKAISAIRALGRCSATSIYAFSEKRVSQMFSSLRAELDRAERLFCNPTHNGRERFSLSPNPVLPISEKYPSTTLYLPGGDKLVAAAIDDEKFPAINIYRIKAQVAEEELICFIENNPEREENPGLCIGVYSFDKDEPVYYDAYEKEKD